MDTVNEILEMITKDGKEVMHHACKSMNEMTLELIKIETQQLILFNLDLGISNFVQVTQILTILYKEWLSLRL